MKAQSRAALPPGWSVLPGGAPSMLGGPAMAARRHRAGRRGAGAEPAIAVSHSLEHTRATESVAPAQEPAGTDASCPQPMPTGEQWLWNYHFGTYRPWALVVAILFCTPLFPLAYPVAVLGLWLARREARHTGWPFVPGRLALMVVLALGAARNIVALALGTHAGLWVLARLLPLLGGPWPVPPVVVHALWSLVHG